MKKRVFALILTAIMVLSTSTVVFAEGNMDSADTSVSEYTDDKATTDIIKIDKKTWVDFSWDMPLNGVFYYSEMVNDSNGAYSYKFKLSKYDESKDKTEKLFTLRTKSVFGRIVTNGNEILNIDNCTYKGGKVDVYTLNGKKKRTIVNMSKYVTSKSTDSLLSAYIYDGNLYYSKYRGLGNYIYKIYKVNIKTGKEKVVSSKYILENYGTLPVYNRYVPVTSKNGTTYMYDVVKKKTVKMGGKDIFRWMKDGEFFYTLHGKKSGSKWKYTVKKRKLNGKVISTVASFSTKYNKDSYAGFTVEGINFNASGEKCFEYNFKTKKSKLTKNPLYRELNRSH